MKKQTVVIILVLVFVVIGVVVYLFAKSNKGNTVTTKTTESSGLGNILQNSNPGIFSLLLNRNKQQTPAVAGS